MAVTKIGTDVEFSGGAAATQTIASAYTPAAGSNRLLVLVLSTTAAATFSGAAWGGSSYAGGQIVLACSVASSRDVYILYIKEADFQPGSNLTLTMSSTANLRVDVYLFDGVDQTTPIAATNTAGDSTSVTSLSAAVTVPTGGYAVAAFNRAYNSGESTTFDGSWTVERTGVYGTSYHFALLTNGSSGSQNPSPSWATSGTAALAVMAIAPYADPSNAARLMLLGVG